MTGPRRPTANARVLALQPAEPRHAELRVALFLSLVLAALVLLALQAAPAAGQEPGGSPTEGRGSDPAMSSEPAADEYVSREICAGCHEQADTFAAGPHGRAMATRGGDLLDRSCVTCHGPAEAHIEDPSPDNIVRIPSDPACAVCHGSMSGRRALAMPAHERNRIACLDCHQPGHETRADPAAEPLLKDAPFELCGGCHRLQSSGFSRPFAHRDGIQPFECTACHTAHGTGRSARLATFTRGGACLDCHDEKAGPFVFPHPPQPVDGCLACHEPHGSTNPRMLTRRTVLNLCLECHAGIPALHDLTQPRFRACQSCHTAVHGSNRDPRLFDE